jgi:hypothetical protein
MDKFGFLSFLSLTIREEKCLKTITNRTSFVYCVSQRRAYRKAREEKNDRSVRYMIGKTGIVRLASSKTVVSIQTI